ncbi:MAG: SMP-30/gluconolactonase/LRE family protein [Acidobacteria bacterium]|nr:SMP-30/gluconolactonase/LRE family protein [Acidobacteriota bacterium]
MTHRTTPERHSAIAALAAAALLFGGGVSAALAQDGAAGRAVDVAATISFTEGPTVDADGAVYFTDLRGAGRILKMAPDGTVATFREPSYRANGLIFDSEWRLLACEGGNGDDVLPRITRTNVETGEVEVLADQFEGRQLHQPNDLTIDGQGRVYFTDRPGANVTPEQTGVHGVYRIDPDGSIARILTEPEVERPNGLVVSPDDSTLYVIETAQQEGGARMIRAFDLAADGTASNMRVFHNFYPGRSGDGMTVDSEGNLYVAAGLNRLRGTSETLDTVAGVHVFSPDGELLEHIPIYEDTITNVAFGGDDLRTLYVTAGKTLFRIRTDVTGTRR